MIQTAKSGSSLSFLFCGIGDGRNLLATLFSLMANCCGGGGGGRQFERVHCTLVDLKPAVLARLLVLFSLFASLPSSGQDLIVSPAECSDEVQDTLCAAVHLYMSDIVPPWVHQRLQDTISDLITKLEACSDGAIPGLEWVYRPLSTRAQVLRHLQHWAQPLDVLFCTYQTCQRECPKRY